MDGHSPADRRLHHLRAAGVDSVSRRLRHGFGGVGHRWATGHKTSNGRISSRAGTGNSVTALTTILELAQRAGLRTGNVSTAEITDATPAVLNSHINERGCQGPANMANCAPYRKENGGPGSIAEQSVDHHVNVLLGGGLARFQQAITGGPDAGKTVVQSAERQGYTVVLDAANLAAAETDHVLGLFNAGNMSLEWSGLQATPFPGSGLPGGQTCVENQRPSSEPSLAEMTAKAIGLLDDQPGRGASNPGFFLQVEGASIDKQDHAESPCQQIGETVAFDRRGTGCSPIRGDPQGHADHRDCRPRAHEPDRTGARRRTARPSRLAEHAADQDGSIVDDCELRDPLAWTITGPHRHAGPHCRARPSSRECRRSDESDRPVSHDGVGARAGVVDDENRTRAAPSGRRPCAIRRRSPVGARNT